MSWLAVPFRRVTLAARMAVNSVRVVVDLELFVLTVCGGLLGPRNRKLMRASLACELGAAVSQRLAARLYLHGAMAMRGVCNECRERGWLLPCLLSPAMPGRGA